MFVPQGIPAKQWSERLIDRLAYAHDASVYRLVPQAVVRPSNEAEVKALLSHSNNTKTPVTFRTGGTSLSGQSITEGIIAEVVRGWQDYSVQEDQRIFLKYLLDSGIIFCPPLLVTGTPRVSVG